MTRTSGLLSSIPRRHHREIIAVLIGSAGSVLGNSIHIVAAALLALQLSGSAASVPIIALVATLPPLCLSGVVQRVVARLGARRTLVGIDALSGLLALSVPLLYFVGALQLWHVYAQELLMACCSAFYAPSSRAWSSAVTRELSEVQTVNSLLSSCTQVASVVGWGVGGALVAATSPVIGILANAGTFLLSALVQAIGFGLLSRGRRRRDSTPEADANVPEEPDAPRPRSVWSLWRTVFDATPSGRLARTLVLVSVVQRLQFSLFVAFVSLAIGASDTVVGLANAAFSVGAAAGGLLVARGPVAHWAREHPRLALLSMFAGLGLFALSTAPLVGIVVYALVGVTSASVIVLQVILQDARRDLGATATFAGLGAAQALANVVALGLLSGALVLMPIRTTYLLVVALGTVGMLVTMRGTSSLVRDPGTDAGQGSATEAGRPTRSSSERP